MGPQREDPRRVISFDIGSSEQRLAFDDAVLSHFDRHRQTRMWHREAGGLLFARLALPTIEVCTITGPRRTDRRSRYSYRPDERAEQREIDEMFRRNLHFVGCCTRTRKIALHPLTSTRETSRTAYGAQSTP
jgi:hypothetical protein